MGMGDRIRERRLSLGLTQEELAAKLGLQKSAIAKYENGRVENIKRSVIFEMSKILKCSPIYLLCLNENECEEPNLVSDQDCSLINKYNKLDQTGKEIIEFILEKELQRANTIYEKETQIDFLKSSTKSTAKNTPANIIMRTYPYFHKIACAGKGFYFDDIPVETM